MPLDVVRERGRDIVAPRVAIVGHPLALAGGPVGERPCLELGCGHGRRRHEGGKTRSLLGRPENEVSKSK